MCRTERNQRDVGWIKARGRIHHILPRFGGSVLLEEDLIHPTILLADKSLTASIRARFPGEKLG
jgi:hypothetical protein